MALDGEPGGSHVLHKSTGTETPLHRGKNERVCDARLGRATGEDNKNPDNMEIDALSTQGFSRPE